MARARSPNSIEAEEMYKNGMKLVDIAKKLDVPASTVRRWKSTQNWDGDAKKKKNERSQKKKTSARHKGGQLGNKNAVGNKGGPLKPGDKIAEKHGAYSSVYWDVLDESEKDMIEDIPMDEEMLLIEQIQLFAVRERRIMIAINKYRNMKGEVSLYGFNRSESKRTFKTEEDKQLYEERIEKKISAEERLPGDMYNMQTTMENKDNMIARLEKELSTVQSKKTKAIEALAKLRLEKQKIAGESKGNEVVRAWAEAVVKARERPMFIWLAMKSVGLVLLGLLQSQRICKASMKIICFLSLMKLPVLRIRSWRLSLVPYPDQIINFFCVETQHEHLEHSMIRIPETGHCINATLYHLQTAVEQTKKILIHS